MIKWVRTIINADSPYPEDRRVIYRSEQYEIAKEGDGNFWLHRRGEPLGFGKTLASAKAAAEDHAARKL